MNGHPTKGKRYLKNGVWHDDNGPLPDTALAWDPPMTDEEISAAALADPDNPPLTDEQLARFRRPALATAVRRKLRLTRQEFAQRFRIPVATLEAWERHQAEPDEMARAYLLVIDREAEIVERTLSAAE